MPPFASGDPVRDNIDYIPDMELLGLLNVRYILAEFDLLIADELLCERFGSTYLYENPFVYPRAWLQPDGTQVNSEVVPAEIRNWTPNQITVQVSGPGLLVLSEIFYPGWQARVDGALVPLESFSGILRAVHVSDGKHLVEFVYRPVGIYLGLVCFVVGALFLLGLVIIKKRDFSIAS